MNKLLEKHDLEDHALYNGKIMLDIFRGQRAKKRLCLSRSWEVAVLRTYLFCVCAVNSTVPNRLENWVRRWQIAFGVDENRNKACKH